MTQKLTFTDASCHFSVDYLPTSFSRDGLSWLDRCPCFTVTPAFRSGECSRSCKYLCSSQLSSSWTARRYGTWAKPALPPSLFFRLRKRAIRSNPRAFDFLFLQIATKIIPYINCYSLTFLIPHIILFKLPFCLHPQGTGCWLPPPFSESNAGGNNLNE